MSTQAEKEAAKIQPTDYVADCEDYGKPIAINTRITKRVKIIEGRQVEVDPTFVTPKEVRCVSCGSKRHLAKFNQ